MDMDMQMPRMKPNRKYGVTATGMDDVKKYGRYGDTEMAHVTPGEKVLPLSVQTPKVNKVVNEQFKKLGLSPERYTVKESENSINPETGEPEFFLKKLVKGVVGAATGFATGGVPGAIAGGLGGLAGSGEQGQATAANGGNGGGYSGTPLPAPVAAMSATKSQVRGLPTTMEDYTISSNVPGTNMVVSPDETMAAGNDSYYADNYMPLPDVNGILPVSGYSPVNPITGKPEYFDMEKSTNPSTGLNEYYDEAYYLKANPDVAKAVAAGQFKSGLDHYNKYGKAENRANDPPAAAPASTGTRTGQDSIKTEVKPQQLYVTSYGGKTGGIGSTDRFLLSDGTVVTSAELMKMMGGGANAYNTLAQSGYSAGSKWADPNKLIGYKVPGTSAPTPPKVAVQSDTTGTSSGGASKTLGTVPTTFDEQYYLESNPDVKKAVDQGVYKSGADHYTQYGYNEPKRSITRPVTPIPTVDNSLMDAVPNQSSSYSGNWWENPDAVSQIKDTLGIGSTTTDTTQSSSSSSGGNNLMDVVPVISSKTPDRTPRFRSSKAEGGYARNF
jgi:hypothetical protein